MNAKIHWARIAWTIAAVASFGIAEAQVSTRVKDTPPERLLPALVPQAALVLPDNVVVVPGKPVLGRPLGQPVVLRDEKGGLISAHRQRFFGYQRDGDKVEVYGGCYSACTLVTAYVPKDKLCFASGAFLAFHSAIYMRMPSEPHSDATLQMYLSYPIEIRRWIDAHGGVNRLKVREWWTMYDRDLWAIGYPRCK